MKKQGIPCGLQRGLTLVEFLVAIALMMMVTAATVALYSVNSGSNKTVDASQGLDDTARYVFEIVGQTIRSAGYPGAVPEESDAGASRRTVANVFDACAASAATTPCPILGFDNSKVVDSQGAVGQKNSGGINSSDALAVRFNGASGASVKSRDEGRGDESFTTCAGTAVGLTTEESQLGLSVFWVKELNGEPELYCSEEYNSPGAGASAGWKRPKPQPMARGVESFQVMYGVDCVDIPSPPPGGPKCASDGVPERWVSASDIDDAEKWRNVRAVRIGMILRGPPGSSTARKAADSDDEYLYPLGEDFLGTQATIGNGLKFKVPRDGRLRRVYISTFMLRNAV